MSYAENTSRTVDPELVQAAKLVSPEAFLRSRYGKDVFAARSGRAIRVENVLRSDCRPNGQWVSCGWYSEGIGDNISLVRNETGCTFADAVILLTGTRYQHIEPLKPLNPRSHENIPPQRPRVPGSSCLADGRRYLLGRGISQSTVMAAERCGALNYCRNAIIFLGRDFSTASSEIRLASLRYLTPCIGEDGKPMTKRDLAGSDKSYPVFLKGDPGMVCVVEGGTNCLAVHDLYKKAGHATPSVIATGGVGIRSWTQQNKWIQSQIQAADKIVMFNENEVDKKGCPDPIKQARTDAMRELTAQSIMEIHHGQMPCMIYPPQHHKDAADWLVEFNTQGYALDLSDTINQGHHR